MEWNTPIRFNFHLLYINEVEMKYMAGLSSEMMVKGTKSGLAGGKRNRSGVGENEPAEAELVYHYLWMVGNHKDLESYKPIRIELEAFR